MAAPEPSYLYLRTRGRRTGLPREIEIWYTQCDGSYYVIAEHPSSHWIQNLRLEPRVEVRLGDQQVPARGRILDPVIDRELIHRIQALSHAKYGWGSGLVVELTPQRQAHTTGSRLVRPKGAFDLWTLPSQSVARILVQSAAAGRPVQSGARKTRQYARRPLQ